MIRFCKAFVDGEPVDVYCGGTWSGAINTAPILWLWDTSTHPHQSSYREYPDHPSSYFAVGNGMRRVTAPATYQDMIGGQRTVAVGIEECAKWLARHALRDSIRSPFVLELMATARKPKAA